MPSSNPPAAKPFFLCGKPATSPDEIGINNPFNGTALATVSRASPEQADQAVAAMVNAFAEMRQRSAYDRQRTCEAVLNGLRLRQAEFAECICRESGKPIKTARAEVDRALTTFRLAVEESTRIGGELLPVDIDARSIGYHAMVGRFPIGPCLFITPFNFPLNLVAHKVAPALACGCPFIVKPSDRTPLTALLLGELLAETDLPPGAWHILPCSTAATQKLAADPRIALVSFTGSAEVGWKIRQAAYTKEVLLELGNNSAVIVEPDVDLADAAKRIAAAAFSYAGQSCISVQRVMMHRTIEKQFTKELIAATHALKLGDPADEQTDVGPVIDQAAADRIRGWITEAVASGAEVLCGIGAQPVQNASYNPTLLPPTLLRNVPTSSPLLRQEAFGPVAILESYDDFDEALSRINAAEFGLQAGVFTHDIRRAQRAFETLDIGGVIINDVPTLRIDNMPYGGVKNSGLGREGVRYAIEHMTYRKVCIWR